MGWWLLPEIVKKGQGYLLLRLRFSPFGAAPFLRPWEPVLDEEAIQQTRRVDACHRKGIWKNVELSPVDAGIGIPRCTGSPHPRLTPG